MTTPNEELILKLRGQAYTTCRPDQLCDQAADLLQSQAECIAELEETLAGRTDYALSLRRRLDTARMESHTLRAQLADAELHTKQVERGLDKATAQLEDIAAAEPVCLIPDYELDYMQTHACGAVYKIGSDEAWDNDADIKLFTRPMPAQDVNAEFVRVIQFAISQDSSASDFLNDWLHGDTDEWPEFTNAKGAK